MPPDILTELYAIRQQYPALRPKQHGILVRLLYKNPRGFNELQYVQDATERNRIRTAFRQARKARKQRLTS